MKIFKSIIWSREERHYFNQLDKWMSITLPPNRCELTEDEIKAAARFARGWGERMSEDNIVESINAWHKIHRMLENQNADAVKLEENLPEEAEGIILRPKQAMICLQEAAVEAMKDIDEVSKLVVRALELLRAA